MNKEALIAELRNELIDMDGSDWEYVEGYNAATTKAMDLIANNLCEPEKPVVPKYVARWFEDNKFRFEQSIYGLSVHLYGKSRPLFSEFEHWFMGITNKPIETLVKMKLFGYEVKKEPQWVVRHDGRIQGSYFREFNGLDGIPFNSVLGAGLKNAYKFDSKEKAEAVALLIDGEVEEVDTNE